MSRMASMTWTMHVNKGHSVSNILDKKTVYSHNCNHTNHCSRCWSRNVETVRGGEKIFNDHLPRTEGCIKVELHGNFKRAANSAS